MAKKEEIGEVKYNWFQISLILKLGNYDREVVRIKYFNESHTKQGWEEILKKDGLIF
jgi:hypothetical protein